MTGPMMATSGRKLSMSKQNELNSLVDALIKHSFLKTTNLNEQFKQYQDMHAVLERIRKVESELKLKINNGKARQSNIETFCRWAKENGCQFDGVQISEFSGFEMGLEATKDFREGDLFVTVPKKLIFSVTEDSKIPDIMKDIPVMMVQNLSNLMLALLLIVERFQPNSEWKPYLDVLPDRYSTVLYFSPAEMAELKGTSAFGSALSQCKNIARQYGFIKKFIQNKTALLKNNFTYDLYCWAASTVMTRQNIIPVNLKGDGEDVGEANDAGLGPSPVLIPFWDMANHTNGQITTGYNEQQQRVESLALKDFQKGDQIFIYYGNRTNADFLVHNGFIFPDNNNNNVSIQLSLNSTEELFAQRKQLLEKLNLPVVGEFTVCRGPNCISADLLAFARVFNMTKEQLAHWIDQEDATIRNLLDPKCVLEPSHREKVWKFLSIRLQLLIRMSSTTLEQDETLLASQGQKGAQKLGHIKTMLVQYRVVEKRILTEAIDYCKQQEVDGKGV
ncbi:actin-histidine N-methyltransferase [Toxorhynchites rutilus septentrionalis]|uniref:actin-histidine N-methyltransferase n=1 Tax=Toxorhynchites rutilus septentrionalis TaxID=329112 RepID=UPI002479A032|nr:actin-histidine N-methyltransferase [Toxorhynchites rutilus septentrionalis]XP_055636982.1 actin-histidine N-methyltransferase [Toxorhynchites rutilus septentrionalis]XP_055636983.1 actin-histidine N-methyltransferase [Toxorhynchites rutilus septentrionalis]XP_055636984.1 actin-histidine N-methyltransferase [Toxorhynchites rutilus septentrionalis]XP_055636985.1 actin-histidine N-methyltransferase [Toxorhynchites rutilus septentrionalis]